ncbi:MAG: O-antigen ligase family protein [Oscillospiraceae bacterium]|nr:O-antigen ligase family protein [Oscillospiraceae bacterium]
MTRKITGQLMLILAIFTCTFFLYRDFGLRMIYGYAVLGVILALRWFDRLRRNEPPQRTPVTLAAAVLACLILLQFLRPDARRDEDTLSYLISMVICIAYVAAAPTPVPAVRRAETAIYWGSMAMALFVVVFTLLPGLFLELVYPLLSETARRYYDFFAPLGYGVSLGTYSYTDYVLYLGMAVCCAELAVKPRTPRRIAAGGLSLAFLALAMVVLGRRGELLAALVAIALLVLALCSRRKRRIILAAGSAAAVLAVVLILVFLPQLGQISFLSRYVETVEQILSGVDFTSGRGPLLALAVTGFLSKPIFGLGWGQYIQLSAQLGMCDTDGNLIEDCHNIYLQFLCETGVVGAVLLLIPIGYLLITACRMLRHAKAAGGPDALRFASLSFLIQFFLLFLGLYDPSFQKLVFWCFYALALLFLNAAMVRSGWRPTGPVSRALARLDGLLTAALTRLRTSLRTPWKEGK